MEARGLSRLSGTRPAVACRWRAAASLVAESRDLLDDRPGRADTFGTRRADDSRCALVSRGWDSFLLSLDDRELDAIEVHGTGAPWPERTPEALRALVERARRVCDLPRLSTTGGSPTRARRGESPRKRAQIDAFSRVVTTSASRAVRVIDVGSGHGHLTRDIAGRIGRPVVGLERDAALAEAARRLSSGASPTFAVTDVLHDGLALSAGDCVVGLHACGELGDAIVAGVAHAPGSTLALVGCCLQKRRQPSRRPLRATPGLEDALDLPSTLLGLSNLVAGDDGVEASRGDNLLARERRLTLHRLLSEGRPLRLGAEIEGLNRRAAHRDLSVLVARAFAIRGQPAPARQAIDEAARWAHAEHARRRRLSVPRALLARALEVYVLLDRAAYLEENGFEVMVGALFATSVSPRNLALVAWPKGERD
jgi:SAM-dependent methyltransferase